MRLVSASAPPWREEGAHESLGERRLDYAVFDEADSEGVELGRVEVVEAQVSGVSARRPLVCGSGAGAAGHWDAEGGQPRRTPTAWCHDEETGIWGLERRP
ncbi:hypothetical protein [Haloarcula marina]|uniref:hypothetical protein n=1 Tax=Haloarcula marina TaxID=2961574 RepID=UPI0020B6EC04|nr:hypothetical protein [Halomicroarcula marina]